MMNIHFKFVLIGLLVLFVLLRIPGLSVPYQQDEFKTAIAAEAGLAQASAFLTHPPLTALFMRGDAILFGGEHMRVMPLLFGVLSAVLLYAVVRRRFDEQAAVWAVGVYAISFYGVWASLMIDTDGAILPTFFLAALYCYDRLRDGGRIAIWGTGFGAALLTGLLVKLSFILVVGVFAADFLFSFRRHLTLRHIAYLAAAVAAFVVCVAGAFSAVSYFNPAFEFQGMITHALYYMRLSGRSYLQVLIQTMKAVFYLSPLLIVPLFFVSKDIVKKSSPFVWYLIFGGIFYFVLFDFSHGALDKYLMFTIVPLCVFAGVIFSRHLQSAATLDRRAVFVGALCAGSILMLALLPAEAVALYPKTAWFSRVIQGHWNVLTPFNGGSGPVGFYVSFLVIGISFVAAGATALLGRFNRKLAGAVLTVVLGIGLAYNAVFIEEFSRGALYGSASEALQPALAYLSANDSINGVITYNDIGAYELKHMGKYTARFYAAPQFENEHKMLFTKHAGAFLVVDIPPLYDGFYRDFLNSCKVLFMTRSGFITSTVYTSCTWTKE